MKVAIAGGSGFVGRHLLRRLRAEGHDVRVLARGQATGPGGHVASDSSSVAVDLAGDPDALTAALAGCDAVVNLVGVKTERAQGFAAAHVTAVARLVAACERAGIHRLVHVSVAGARDDPGRPYLASKWRGEQAVTGSGLAWTIVRPGVIFGAGDDFVTNLTAMLRQAAIFPAPGGGSAALEPVAVDDVADAIAAALGRPDTAGQIFDVVGPERLPLRGWITRVAAALGLRAWIVPVPAALLAPPVAAMERLLRAPPLTRAQLGLLGDGVTGDLTQTRALLGRSPRPLDGAQISALAAAVGPWLGVSLRLVRGDADRRTLAAYAPTAARLGLLVPLATLLITGLRAGTDDIWRCMMIANLILIPGALLGLGLPWRALLRPRGSYLVFGAGAFVVLYALGWLATRGLRAGAPALMGQLAEIYAWAALLPPMQALVLLALVVCGEEIFWRVGVALPVAGRFGPWWGCLASAVAFTLAHLYVGPPVLWVAAFGCGLAWAWMAVKWRSAWPGIVCHYLWDVAVMFVAPY